MIIGINNLRVCQKFFSKMLRVEKLHKREHFESVIAFNAFIMSLKKDGHRTFFIDDPSNYPKCDLVLSFNIPKYLDKDNFSFESEIWKTQAERGDSVLVFEAGYVNRELDNPKPYFSLGFNGLNGRAKFVRENMPSDRWDKLGVEIKPWREGGNIILFCGQIPDDGAVQHFDYENLLTSTMIEVGNRFNKLVTFRPHPLHNKKEYIFPQRIFISENENIKEDFEDCFCVCAANSNSLVEATIEGIPTITCDYEGCMVKSVTNKLEDIIELGGNKLSTFDRESWKNNLAYSQWTCEEMLSGEAWQHLKAVFDSGVELSYVNYLPSNINLDQTPSV